MPKIDWEAQDRWVEAFQKLAPKIAIELTLLDPERLWQIKDVYKWNQQLITSAGHCICLSLNQSTNRIAITGQNLEISVSATRTPEAIAQDIKQRFLADYLRKHEAAIVSQQERAARDRKLTETIKRLGDILGLKPLRDREFTAYGYVPTNRGIISIDAEIKNSGEITFKDLGNIPPQLAAMLLQTIATYAEMNPPIEKPKTK